MDPDEDILGELVSIPSALIDRVTTALDVLGVLVLAAGVAWGSWRWIGPWGLVAGALVVLGASRMAARATALPAVEPSRHRRARARERRDRPDLRLVREEAL